MKKSTLAALSIVMTSPAFADEYQDRMRAYYQAELSEWANSAVLIDAITAQNLISAGYSQAQIDQMDLDWRAQVGQPDAPMVTQVLENAASDYLRTQVDGTGAIVTEVFAMDSRGLNVAASHVTSDYWQGDEDKFIHSFGDGPGAIHFGEIELDDSTQTYQAQVSIPVLDPETQTLIGAITFGLNADALS